MPTTLVNIPQSNLGHNAGFSSVPAPGPVALPADCASLTCTLSMAAGDQTDTANAVTWTVYVAPPGAAPTQAPPTDGSDQGNGWKAVAREIWRGGTFVDHAGNTQPSPLVFTEGLQAQYRGGWLAANGQNLGPTLKVGCSVVSNP